MGVAHSRGKDKKDVFIAFTLQAATGDLRTAVEIGSFDLVLSPGMTFRSPLGMLGVTCDGHVTWWNVNCASKLGSIETPTTSSGQTDECVAISPNGGLLAVGGHSRLVVVYDVETRQRLLCVPFDSSVDDVAFSPADNSLNFIVRGEIISYSMP